MRKTKATAGWFRRLLLAGGSGLMMAGAPSMALVVIEPSSQVVPSAQAVPSSQVTPAVRSSLAAEQTKTVAKQGDTVGGVVMLLCSLAFTVMLLRGRAEDRD